MHSIYHICTKDSLHITLQTDKGARHCWYWGESPSYAQVLADADVTEDIVGMDTLDKLKSVFAEAQDTLDNLADLNYSGLKVRVFCESV